MNGESGKDSEVRPEDFGLERIEFAGCSVLVGKEFAQKWIHGLPEDKPSVLPREKPVAVGYMAVHWPWFMFPFDPVIFCTMLPIRPLGRMSSGVWY